MNIEFIPLFSFVFVTSFTPGPNNISCASMGVILGYRKSLRYMLGISAGFFMVMTLAALLSGFLLSRIPVAESILRWVGSGYILWLAFGILRSGYSDSRQSIEKRAFLKGFFLQLLNPKGVIYGLTLFSTFLAPIADKPFYQFIASVAGALVAFSSISVWALFGATIKERLKNPGFRKVLNLFLALLLVYTAVDLSGLI